MELKTFRAATMQEALSLVRRELGPTAVVLHTREVRGPVGLATRSASLRGCCVGPGECSQPAGQCSAPTGAATVTATTNAQRGGQDFPRQLQGQLSELHSMVERLCRNDRGVQHDLPPALFELFTDLIEDDVRRRLRGNWSIASVPNRLPRNCKTSNCLASDCREWSNGRFAFAALSRAARALPPGGLGRPDRCGQNHDHREIGRQFSSARKVAVSV